MRLVANNAEFERYLAAATIFWRKNTLPVIDGSSDDRWILVEALHQDIRVTLRNLAIANALRRVFPARLLVYTGTDEDWYTALWSGFDVGLMDRLARAHGADTVIDIHRAVDGRLAGGQPPPLVVGDRTIRETGTSIEPADMDETVEATTCRVLRVPRLTETDRAGEVYARVRDRSQQFAEIYEALFSGLNMAALITSHVDYNHWGLAVQTAKRFATPVVHVQSTGSLKAYAMFPENRADRRLLREARCAASRAHPAQRRTDRVAVEGEPGPPIVVARRQHGILGNAYPDRAARGPRPRAGAVRLRSR
jgi:hypothetical protein